MQLKAHTAMFPSILNTDSPHYTFFHQKKERDKWVYDNDVLNGNINHRCWEIKAREAYRAYRDKWTGELIAVYH